MSMKLLPFAGQNAVTTEEELQLDAFMMEPITWSHSDTWPDWI